ncbi:MAG: hypothetical protein OXF06_12165 [Bacteroidetes bacterium]|nr:hypothetical protein [Bacteroidota bacterium]
MIEITEGQGHHLTEDDRRQLSNPEVRKKIKQNAWANHLSDDHFESLKSLEILMNKNIGVLLINNRYKSFIIGDDPVVRGANQQGSWILDDHGVMEFLPVSHDVIIYWGRDSSCHECTVLTDHDIIRNINERILGQSSIVAGRSKDLLSSLSRSRAAQALPISYDNLVKVILRELWDNST